MIEVQLPQLQRMLGDLVDDLRNQVAGNDELRDELREEWRQATSAQRTGATFETWLEDPLDQAAVAWLLGCVFVRFCEDNHLVNGLWIGGPTEHAPAVQAAQRMQAYLTTEFRENERGWLREAFTHLRGLPTTDKIFDHHNPVWRFDISGDAAKTLLEAFRHGTGVGSLHTEDLDTRFLGDLYQDLSAHAKKTYALLQTPEFVEEFILDRTFEPSIREFGLAATKVIDPACGSGHFLIGAFRRLVARWRDREPDTDIRVLTQRALDQVTGVDINPFAVAIARFRLLIAALRTCRVASLETAPDFRIRVAAGDSLLAWGLGSSHQGDLLASLGGRETFAYYTEDGDSLGAYLRPGQYTVVLANPPYITVKDKARNEKYRELYVTCSGKYALTTPFAERMFQLARHGDHGGEYAGWVGQITANSFMKREFGKKLIGEFFAHRVELAEIVDTSGAYIPGHGTPTLILVGRNRLVSSRYSTNIRTVLGIRGEPTQPEIPAVGQVWSAIVKQIDQPGSESKWVGVSDFPRIRFESHPWSLSGGGSGDLRALLESEATGRITDHAHRIGFYGVLGSDEAMMAPAAAFRRSHVEREWTAPLTIGDETRNWVTAPGQLAFHPYDHKRDLVNLTRMPEFGRWLWPYRTELGNRATFSKGTYFSEGRPWWEWHQLPKDTDAHRWAISFAFVATHNHFVLDRGGKVFNRSAPVIKLAADATEDDHLKLLGVLNSSTACFWLKQVSHNKGSTVDQYGARQTTIAWENFYEFTGTKLQQFPLPSELPSDLPRRLDQLAEQVSKLTPTVVASNSVPTRDQLATTRNEYQSVRARMISLQEELDWRVYRLYGLTDDELTVAEAPELRLGERAFEIVLARRVDRGEVSTEWFTRHGSTPVTEVPNHWPDEYRAVVEKRISLIESDRNIGLIERPEYKRRWQTPGWDAMQQAALRSWLLDRLEAPELWGGGQPVPMTVAQLADRVRHDEDFRAVLELWVGSDQYDLAKTVAKLVGDEHVPFLPAQRYKASGLRKRAEWERTWALQRREDAGEKVEIRVPPKYTSADFAKPSYWRARGKLDVPKERFVSYPGASPDEDGSLLLGWAGWDHLAQARALAAVYLRRREVGWPRERRLPLLAGLVELEPWLHQWHGEPSPDFPGASPAAFFTGLIDTELSALDADRADLRELRGVEELS